MANADDIPASPRANQVEGGGLLIAFALPLAMGLFACVLVGWWWFNDLDAVLCGAWRVAHYASAYEAAAGCPGGRPSLYMYLPQLARMLAPIAGGADISGLRAVFGVLNFAIVGGLIWALFLRPMDSAPRGLRAPILALTSGTAVASANIAFGCHALVLAAALRRKSAWPLIAAIVAVSAIKPIYLTYLLVFAYEPERLAVRAGRIAAGVAAAAVVGAVILATGGPELAVWREGLTHVTLGQHLGFSFISWAHSLGLSPTGRAVQVAYVGFAAMICLAGLAIVEARGLSREARTLLALAIAQVLNPRLMIYDVLMLAPLAIAFATVPEAWRRAFRFAVIGVGVLAFGVQLSRIYELIPIAPGLLTLLLLGAGVLAARDLRGRRA